MIIYAEYCNKIKSASTVLQAKVSDATYQSERATQKLTFRKRISLVRIFLFEKSNITVSKIKYLKLTSHLVAGQVLMNSLEKETFSFMYILKDRSPFCGTTDTTVCVF